MRTIFFLTVFATAAWPQAQPAAPPAAVQGNEKLDSLTAPIALYPDALLSQVLMASTYPDQIAQAAKWSKQHPDQKGDAAVKQVSAKPWDPSVQSLVAFPQVLATLQEKPDWVKSLGQAFLAQPDAVMDSVQRLRHLAKANGNLESNPQQTVQTQPAVEGAAPQETTIQIEPTNPEVVYVPSYNPTSVYGAWPYPAYPPTYIPPPYGFGIAAGVATGLAFGAGIATRAALWGGFNWGRHDVNININRYNSININRQINNSSWKANNQQRINNAQRTRAQGAVQNRQPGAYRGNAQQRAQGIQRQQAQGAQGRSPQNLNRPSGGARSSGSFSGGSRSSGGFSRGGGGGRRR
jgi:hypothetical protein